MRWLCIFLLIILAPAWILAGDVSLAWDASISPGVTGYKIYIGTSSAKYWSPIIVRWSELSYTVAGLGPGTYYFAVTAFDAQGNESDYSNEVSAIVPQPPFSITSQSCSANWYGVVCLASASAKSGAIFRYQPIGVTGAGWTTIISTPTATKTQHRAVIYFDQGAQQYFNYEWQITDAGGNVVTAKGTFRTR